MQHASSGGTWVAAGTIFLDVLVWEVCRQGHSSAPLYRLKGHEGSIHRSDLPYCSVLWPLLPTACELMCWLDWPDLHDHGDCDISVAYVRANAVMDINTAHGQKLCLATSMTGV